MSDNKSLNIAVIGGGPGGYAAAFLAADLGMSVTLIDPELNPGGVCLYRGCIPSKRFCMSPNCWRNRIRPKIGESNLPRRRSTWHDFAPGKRASSRN